MKITEIPGISPARQKALEETGVHTPMDLLRFFPRNYLDRRTVLPVANLKGIGEKVTVMGRIVETTESGFGRKKRFEAILQDESGRIKGVWFKGISYFRKSVKKGQFYAFFGTVKRYGRFLSMAHPETEQLSVNEDTSGQSFTGIMPVYPGNKFFKNTYITSGLLRKWALAALERLKPGEFLPPGLLRKLGYPERSVAFRHIHSPETPEQHSIALERFKFEELFLFELSVVTLKKEVFDKALGPVMSESRPFTSRFFNQVLPFELTDGQKKALGDVKRDIRSGNQMNRLLQGDVGSGKTVVAIGALLMAVDSGYQAVMMAPTEILAEQHYHSLSEWLQPLGITIRLLTGNQKKALRYDIQSDISGGTAHIVVGTHAIIQENIRFHRLGMAVIDEQHRFGVSQRAQLREKGENPHILVMSATPIPRSLAMTLYSDLDLSVIRDLPPGRKPVKTRVVSEKNRKKVHDFLKEQLGDGGQVYIVYPLIEESEAMDLKNATEGYDQIRVEFPGSRAGLLHGRMSADEKEQVMRDFKENRIQILVSTTVIEVGVNVPNASVMVVEHSERFGLSQLHQLRGRIGRGARQSYCLLMTDVKQSKEARSRLGTMEETTDGFKIAEADLKLRGPGDFLGTRQSGLPEFRHADILTDQYLLEQAKNMAFELLEQDPELDHPELSALKKAFLPYLEKKKKFFQMS
ncbi:ATP-dependent DNA helicase RecG [Natronogracilivirga saccharolytica]|uniref:ATP-dependent DNA helicase RecG n=1 Tax=Natronogracilivirga saccharolytica TaxID=2812953 RepID=A0A8J7S8L1_9BACT|nr:ATP-dependent DNA helicase RecG [Natronogracilivirga saccharolytica]MBP3192251.1 ATP-dependent DNA helicase RecG [Natronogracilivirga saccharolytica]